MIIALTWEPISITTWRSMIGGVSDVMIDELSHLHDQDVSNDVQVVGVSGQRRAQQTRRRQFRPTVYRSERGKYLNINGKSITVISYM